MTGRSDLHAPRDDNDNGYCDEKKLRRHSFVSIGEPCVALENASNKMSPNDSARMCASNL